jgi:hypothetical protein
MEECGMLFNDTAHLEMHMKVHVHKSNHNGVERKWDWEK